MAAKSNTSPSQIDKTSFFWAGMCGICHPGGGPAEYDRDGMKYFDPNTGTFGYQQLGLTSGDVTLDGDYSVIDGTGQAVPARWDVTGTSEPDCLMCHRTDRSIHPQTGANLNWVWRAATIRGREGLVDNQGQSVPAYSAGPTAGQGWFSDLALASLPAGQPPKATSLQIDYGAGIANDSLSADQQGNLQIAGGQISKTPKDYACWGCHITSDLRKRGMVWFQEDFDVHYKAFNKLADADPSNDVVPTESTACSRCHRTGPDHNIAKGNAFLGSVQNITDYAGMLTCYECHLPGPQQDPTAPVPTSDIHSIPRHLDVMSCEMCHIPTIGNSADIMIDNATSGVSMIYKTNVFLSADPLNPAGSDTSRWWPGAGLKTSRDAAVRIYPHKPLLTAWWGDWNQAGTPNDLSDDVVSPVILWRLRQITQGNPLPVVTDDNGDGLPEVNTAAEINAYLQALTGVDSNGVQIANRPVLVKGGKIYYLDALSPTGVSSLVFEGTGMHAESTHTFSLDHNVAPASQALGSTGCSECHMQWNGGNPTQVWDRLILVDPWDETGTPQYETLRHLLQGSGIEPL